MNFHMNVCSGWEGRQRILGFSITSAMASLLEELVYPGEGNDLWISELCGPVSARSGNDEIAMNSLD